MADREITVTIRLTGDDPGPSDAVVVDAIERALPGSVVVSLGGQGFDPPDERDRPGTQVHRAITEGRMLYQDRDLRRRDPSPAEIVAASRPRHIEITRDSMAKALEALDFWGATDEQAMAILGAGLHGMLLGWRRGIGIDAALDDKDVSERLTAVVVIIHHLGRLFAAPEDVLAWMRSSNSVFGGMSPLERMASGRIEGLEEVRIHLRRRVAEEVDDSDD